VATARAPFAPADSATIQLAAAGGPVIETPRLLLRSMRAEDVDDLLVVFTDPRVMASFGGIRFDRDDMTRWLNRNLAHQARWGYGLFSIIHKADNLLIGDCGLEHQAADNREAELGYDLRSDYWNQGLATEAAAAVRDHAFAVLGLPALCSQIRQGNARSRRVAEKIGMRYAGDLVRDGVPYWRFALAAGEARPERDGAATVARTNGQNVATGSVPVDGARLWYEEAGEGPPLVLLNAGIADSRMWDRQLPALAERFRTIRYDARGAGRSDPARGSYSPRADLVALLDALGIGRAHLVGLSLGGAVALDAALEFPDRVASLVLAGARPSGLPSSDRLLAAWAAVGAAAAAGDLDRANELELALWVDGPRRSPQQVDPAVRELVRAMNGALLAGPDEGEPRPLDPPAVGRLAEVGAPTLVLAGDADQPDVLAAADLLAREIPGARKVLIADAAHLPNLERPAQSNRLVLDFLAGVA